MVAAQITVPFWRSSRARVYMAVVLPPPPIRAVTPDRTPSSSHSSMAGLPSFFSAQYNTGGEACK